MGRRPAITKEQEEIFCKHLKRGKTIAIASAMAGFSERTAYRYMQKGRETQSRGRYWQFSQNATKAIMEARSHLIDKIWDAIDKTDDPILAMKMLERIDKTYSRVVNVDHQGTFTHEHEQKIKEVELIGNKLSPIHRATLTRIGEDIKRSERDSEPDTRRPG